MSEPVRKYEFKPLETVSDQNKNYVDQSSGEELKPTDLVWTRDGELVKGTDEQAQRDYEVEYGNPTFELPLRPMTVTYNKNTRKLDTRFGDTFEDRFANLLNAPTANQLKLSYEKQLPHQENDDIQWNARMKKRNADRYVRSISMSQFNKEEMNNLVNMAVNLGGLALLAPSLLFAPVATIGALVGGGLGGYLYNKRHIRKTGKTFGKKIEDKTNGYIKEENAEFINPGALSGGIFGSVAAPTIARAAIAKFPNTYGNRVLWDLSNYPGEQSLYGAWQEGRYITNLKQLAEEYRALHERANFAKEAVAKLNKQTESIRVPNNVDYPEGNYEGTGFRIRNRRRRNGSTYGTYYPSKNKISMSLLENKRSNIIIPEREQLWTASHEFEHSVQTNEGHGLSREGNDYWVPNEQHSLYDRLKVLNTKNKFIRDKWSRSPDEIQAEVMAYRVVNGDLPKYDLMTPEQQNSLVKYLSIKFLLPKDDIKSILSALAEQGY